MGGQNAVLADHRTDVGQSADGGQIQQLLEIGLRTAVEPSFLTQLTPQADDQVKSNPDSGQAFEMIRAVRSLRIDERLGFGPVRAEFVMVGDQDFKSGPGGGGQLFMIRRPAIDRNDQLDPLIDEFVQASLIEAVAVGQPAGMNHDASRPKERKARTIRAVEVTPSAS